MRPRVVTVTGSWRPAQAVSYAVATWFPGRRPSSIKMLDPRLYLVSIDDIEFVVVVEETGRGYRVRMVEESVGPRGARVM